MLHDESFLKQGLLSIFSSWMLFKENCTFCKIFEYETVAVNAFKYWKYKSKLHLNGKTIPQNPKTKSTKEKVIFVFLLLFVLLIEITIVLPGYTIVSDIYYSIASLYSCCTNKRPTLYLIRDIRICKMSRMVVLIDRNSNSRTGDSGAPMVWRRDGKFIRQFEFRFAFLTVACVSYLSGSTNLTNTNSTRNNSENGLSHL